MAAPEQPSQTIAAPEDLEGLRTVDALLVVGAANSGKTTLMEYLMLVDPRFGLILSDIDRRPRPGEVDGVNYHFRTPDELRALVESRECVQSARTPTGTTYATSIESWQNAGTDGRIGVMAVVAAAMPAFYEFPLRSRNVVCVIPESWDSWRDNLNKRPIPPAARSGRMQEALESFTFAASESRLRYVVNGDLEVAKADFVHIAQGHELTNRQLEQQAQARLIAETMRDRLAQELSYTV